MQQLRFGPGDIVLSAPGFSAGCFVITDVNPSRPKNAYNGINVVNKKVYRLNDDTLGMKIGTATAEFLNGGSEEEEGTSPRTALCFEGGKRRAESEAKFGLVSHRPRWQFLAARRPGDQLAINMGRGLESVTFQHVLEKGEKYVFIATNQRGKNYRYPLSALVMATETKRSEAAILEDIRGVDAQLSPENLSWDGERPHHEVLRAQRELSNQRSALVRELGHEPTMAELYPDLAPMVVGR